jgi:hypothetical protein
MPTAQSARNITFPMGQVTGVNGECAIFASTSARAGLSSFGTYSRMRELGVSRRLADILRTFKGPDGRSVQL